MGYTAEHDLQDLFQADPARRAARRMTERTGEEITSDARRRSPVAAPPVGAVRRGEVGDWLASRGRAPGTLKESWRTGDVDQTGPETWAVESYTEDPVAPHVEWDTMPHRITVRNALRLRFWDAVGIRFAQSVFHPGTSGQHMMRDSLAEADVSFRRIGEEEVGRWARDQERLVA